MPRTLTKMKSFFKRPNSSTPVAPPPMPAIIEVQALSATSSQQQISKAPQQPTEPAHVQKITAQQIRELRELIRYRYSLDIEIWRQRGVKEYKRDKLKENMIKSDAALGVIRNTLLEWDRREFFATDKEHQKFIEIKNRLLQGVKANWAQYPPWEFVHHGGEPYQGPWEKHGRPINKPPAVMSQARRADSVQSATAGGQRIPLRPSNGGLQSNGVLSGAQHPISEDFRRFETARQSKYRVPPPPPPSERIRSPSMRTPIPSDGNGTPILGLPEPNIGSRRTIWDAAEGRVTGLQWQNDPVDYDRQ
ncbi:hypothetical protein BU25DRAFT_265504 [Macroventuria anomochaeta]|uniref:Uncharacterized protein n=1 Tax=Macroventuria anomochaeta TaxID=301207 RepID=A0ACB6S7Q5_9PLEO|nr:uncharacterized protein BU25DRAFT_265504 [Macroventuria anomochaeta]KAF2630094.1 hypothetical protein BU25DRAFT_265504 [Macroventuria anomochaeta]